MAASALKMILFQTKIRFLGHDIYQRTIKPIQRSLAFADKFPDEIKDCKQFYELILVDTKSAIITHTLDKFNPG